jgi:hypothetical protein
MIKEEGSVPVLRFWRTRGDRDWLGQTFEPLRVTFFAQSPGSGTMNSVVLPFTPGSGDPKNSSLTRATNTANTVGARALTPHSHR